MENFKLFIPKIILLIISLCLVWVIHTFIKPNQYNFTDFYPLEVSNKLEYETYFIRYGPLGNEVNFKGYIEFENTTEIIISNNNSRLFVRHLSVISKEDIIATVDGINIISEFDGYVLNINTGNDIVIEIIEYQNINLMASINQVDFIRLNMNKDYKMYIGNTAYKLKLNSWYCDYKNLKYILKFDNIPKEITYLHNDVINLSQEIILNSVYSIPNFLLTNEVETNKYELLIYNPTLQSNNVYTKIIEVKFVPGYSNSEIVSNNLELYEQIIFNKEKKENNIS